MNNVTNPVSPEARLALQKIEQRRRGISALMQHYGVFSHEALIEALATENVMLKRQIEKLQP